MQLNNLQFSFPIPIRIEVCIKWLYLSFMVNWFSKLFLFHLKIRQAETAVRNRQHCRHINSICQRLRLCTVHVSLYGRTINTNCVLAQLKILLFINCFFCSFLLCFVFSLNRAHKRQILLI